MRSFVIRSAISIIYC